APDDGLARTLHDVGTRVRVEHVAGHQGSRSCTGRSSTSSMNASEATGPLSRYGPHSAGRGDRITSSPSLRMNTSSVSNWNSFGNRTAWLRLFLNTLARRCIVECLRSCRIREYMPSMTLGGTSLTPIKGARCDRFAPARSFRLRDQPTNSRPSVQSVQCAARMLATTALSATEFHAGH